MSSDKENKDLILGAILGPPVVIVVYLLALSLTALRGWAISFLWQWFLVEEFGLPEMSVPRCIAIYFLVSCFTHQWVPTPKVDVWKWWLGAFVGPVLWIATGFLIKQAL